MKLLCISLIVMIVAAGSWWLIRPGVFTVQPIGALPDGATVIYHSRGPEMPIFASPDGLCLMYQGSVSLLCRVSAISGVEAITKRIMFRLPYSRTAYLLSTGGQEFDR